MNDLERIIESCGVNIKFEGNLGTFIYPDELAQAIIDAGYVKKSEIGVDRDKLRTLLINVISKIKPESRVIKIINPSASIHGIIDEAISQSIQSLIVRKDPKGV